MHLNTDYPQIVLVMHEPLGSALATCVNHIYGKTHHLTVVDIAVADQPEPRIQQLYDLIINANQSTLLLCDLIGATPFNIAQSAFKKARLAGAHVDLITGANLGMILKAVGDRHTDPRHFVNAIRNGAVRGILTIEERS